MQIGVFSQPTTVDKGVEHARLFADAGFGSFWMPQIFGVDALTTLAVVAREVPDIRLGTAVVPTYPRTVQQVAGGRLTLGIGLSHQMVIEGMFGMSFDKPVRHMREYLAVLGPLLRGEPSDAAGETITGRLALDIPDSTPVETLLAALGTQMLGLAAREAQGTATWMTGAGTVASHIAPTINAAAVEAGRPAPRIVCALPVCVTDDVDAARAQAATDFAVYGMLPSYRAMLDREGVEGPADLAIVGDAAVVRDGVERFFAAGATEFVAVPYANREATLEVLAGLL